MNRFTKECYKEYLKAPEKTKLSIIEEVITLLPKKLSSKKIFLASKVKAEVSKWYVFSTIKGAKNLEDVEVKIDKIKPVMVFLPCGEFAPDSDGRFIPLGHEKQVNAVLREPLEKVANKLMYQQWKKISRYLSTKNKVGAYEEAILSYKDLDQHHVYFIKDLGSPRIKIGISKHPELRIKQIIREYNCDDAEIIYIIKNGGRTLEAELHSKFHHLQLRDVKGREWFKESKELYDFISSYQHLAA